MTASPSAAEPDPPRQRLRRSALLAALFIFATLVMLRPAPADLDDTVPVNPGDSVLVTWILRHGAHSMVTDPLDVFQAPMFWPNPDSFAYSESMLPVAPVYGAVELVVRDELVAFNLLVLGFFVFNLATAYALAARILRRRDAAIFTAFAFGFTGYAMARFGHPHLQPIGVFPLGYLAMFRLLEAPSVRRGVLAGLANAVAFLTALYYGAIWGVCFGVALVGWAALRRFRVPRATLVSIGVMLAVTAVLVLPVARVYARNGLERPLVPQWGLDVRDVFTPPRGTYVHGYLDEHGTAIDRDEHIYFPGLITLALAAVAALVVVVRAVPRRFGGPRPVSTARWDEFGLVVAGGAIAIALSIGPSFGGSLSPFRFFHEHVPGFEGIRVASRLAVPGLLAGALAAGLGLAALIERLPRRFAFGAVALACVVVMVELAAPVPRVPFDRDAATMAVYHELDDRPNGAVVELPIVVPTIDARYWPYVEAPRLLRATTDWNPRFNGYSGDIPASYVDDATVLNDFPSAASLARARRLDLRYVVLHVADEVVPGAFDEESASARLARLPPGTVASRFGDAWLIDLAP